MPDDPTQLLMAVADGHESAVNKLLPLVYDELRKLADGMLRGERPNHTLQATALVHEVYLKLVDQRAARWKDRAHFFAVAAQAMRRILVDHARTRKREKRGGPREKVSLETAAVLAYEQNIDLLALDEALNKLATESPQTLRVVEMRYFGGLTIEETAAVLESSVRTINREWRYGCTWLYQELGGGDAHAHGATSHADENT